MYDCKLIAGELSFIVTLRSTNDFAIIYRRNINTNSLRHAVPFVQICKKYDCQNINELNQYLTDQQKNGTADGMTNGMINGMVNHPTIEIPENISSSVLKLYARKSRKNRNKKCKIRDLIELDSSDTESDPHTNGHSYPSSAGHGHGYGQRIIQSANVNKRSFADMMKNAMLLQSPNFDTNLLLSALSKMSSLMPKLSSDDKNIAALHKLLMSPTINTSTLPLFSELLKKQQSMKTVAIPTMAGMVDKGLNNIITQHLMPLPLPLPATIVKTVVGSGNGVLLPPPLEKDGQLESCVVIDVLPVMKKRKIAFPVISPTVQSKDQLYDEKMFSFIL